MNNKNRFLKKLIADGYLNQKNQNDLQKVSANFQCKISKTMLSCIDKNDEADPIAKQFLPDAKELKISPLESDDPIGDATHSPVKGIIHRYPDRCLLLPLKVCAVYCRFCFRRENIGPHQQSLTLSELNAAYDYITLQPQIWEVILTGGDPLLLKPNAIKTILKRLSAIKHVEIIRIHTRIPVVWPNRINEAMLHALQSHQPVYVVLHANHPNEFTQAAIKACHDLVNAGIPMISQTTLLKGVNDEIETLSSLMRLFIKNRIKPYYLHQADLARGTQHFRTSIAKGQELMRQLRGRFSGICQPTYVIDIPGGFGKMPIGPAYLHKKNASEYFIEDYQGHFHSYKIK